MKIFVKFNFNVICNKVLEDKLNELDVKFRILGFGEVEILQKLTDEKEQNLHILFKDYGIDVVENEKIILVQKVKDAIREIVFNSDEALNIKTSVYLAEKLGHSYGYLSNLFSEITYTSIENFIILQKIEYAKQLILTTNLSLTEIAFNLNYSSVAHLSTQFKNTTGITPSTFQRIISKRKEIAQQND
jgi:AraC-like DNA-binding protein